MTSAFENAKNAILRDGEVNGGLTNRSLFDLMVAAHEDEEAWDASIEAKIDDHLDSVPHMDHAAFAAFIEGRNALLADATKEVLAEGDRRCKARRSGKPQARRKDDPPDAVFVEDREGGDIRRFWRFGKWVVVVGGGALIVFGADALVHLIFGM
ncbi:MAG: hypothetical protein WCP98_09915 [Actinomycetes bacterium]